MIEDLHINSFLFRFPEVEQNTQEGFAEAKKIYNGESSSKS